MRRYAVADLTYRDIWLSLHTCPAMKSPQPENLEEAKRFIRELCATVEQLTETVRSTESQLAWLKQQLFGRKSERYAAGDEPSLFDGLAEGAVVPATEGSQSAARTVTYERAASSVRGKRQPIPDNLPRVDRVHDLPESEKVGMKLIDRETSEQLEYEPGKVYVIRHIRLKYARIDACLDGSEPNVVTAEKPDEGLAKCMAGPGLLGHIMVSKFTDHLPLHRLEGILKRSGVSVPRSSMCRWAQDVAGLCRPVVMRMKACILGSHVIQADETPVKQQVEGRGRTGGGSGGKSGGRGSLRTCYFWSYVGDVDHPCIVFDYRDGRSRAGPNAWFTDGGGDANYHGYLQCDAYTGYHELFTPMADGGNWEMTHVGCWAHVRRKFYDVRIQFPGPCHHALGRIRLLYEIEARGRGLDPAARQALRDRESRPIVDALLAWGRSERDRSLPRSGLGEAVGYLLNQAESLTRYLDDGRLEIDNNACERSLRGIAIGRKNWLFTGSAAGGQAAATLFSLIASARRNEIEPLAYLTDLIRRLPATPISRVDQFLPHLWKPGNA